MATLSPVRAAMPLLSGLEVLGRGKVRTTYRLKNGVLCQEITPAISIFDHILNATVSKKAEVLCAMSVFWFKKLEAAGFKTHLLAYGIGIDEYLPQHLRNNPDLQARVLIVRECTMVPVEFVFRNCGTGSLLNPKKRCGHTLPDDFQDGDLLPEIWFTPTTKADVGNDEPLDAATIHAQYPKQTEIGLRAFRMAIEHAARCGIILADTKLELADDGTIADEVFTPDSSRCWDKKVWEDSRLVAVGRRAPSSYDKQVAREWGKTMGIDKLKPEIPEHVARAHAILMPPEVIANVTRVYLDICYKIFGMSLERFQGTEMGITI